MDALSGFNVTNNGEASRRLIDIESKARLSSSYISSLSDNPEELDRYLHSGAANTFSELLFRLTHEVYPEDKAAYLWSEINSHRRLMLSLLGRDIGILVAALDFLSNLSNEIINPKIIDDIQLELAADMATRDSLTGLYMRHVFNFTVERMVSEYSRYGKDFSLLMVDIDNFKAINGRYGHQGGDDVLCKIGRLILAVVRKVDLPTRYGGEEIAIILAETSIDQARMKAERLCKTVRRYFSRLGMEMTVSIGVSSMKNLAFVSDYELINQADVALFRAKNSGKNKVVVGSKESNTMPAVI